MKKFKYLIVSGLLGSLILLVGCEPINLIPDTLKVVSTIPAANAIGVLENTVISVNFSEKISAPTAEAIKLLIGDSAVACSIAVENAKAIISPLAGLKKSTAYTVVVPVSVTDLAGNHLAQEYRWNFTTVSTNFQVVSTIPAANATGVLENTVISVNFSEKISAPTATAIKLLIGESAVACTIAVENAKAIISPLAGLKKSTAYTVVVPKSVTDLAGNHLAQEYRWNFTTVEEILWSLDGNITDVATDANGNVYVVGTFWGSNTMTDCFVARFNSDGKFAWRKNIVTPAHDYPHGGIIVVGDVVYAHISRNDIYGIGNGEVYVDAYYCQTGELKWSTKITSSNAGSNLAIDENGYIYSLGGSLIVVLNPNGDIVKSYLPHDVTGFDDAVIINGAIFGAGSCLAGDLTVALIRRFDMDFNVIWDKKETDVSQQSNAQSIIVFSKDSLIIIGESSGNLFSVPFKTSVVCYKLRTGGLDLIWKKPYSDGVHIGLKKCGNNDFYVFSDEISGAFSGSVNGPIKMSTSGDILWTASPKKNGNIAIFGGKVFVADGSGTLTVYNL